MDVARDDQELLVVTENGFGKRTSIDEYRKTSRGAKGVQTIKFSEQARRPGRRARRPRAPGARVHLPGGDGAAHRRPRHPPATGRAAQGVTVMNVREDDRVSAVALVVESDSSTAAVVESDAALADGPIDLAADSGDVADVPTDVPTGGARRRRFVTRQRGLLFLDHQRKEVVRITSHSSCGTLEVAGR